MKKPRSRLGLRGFTVLASQPEGSTIRFTLHLSASMGA